MTTNDYDPNNTCPICRSHAHETAIEGMVEVIMDDNDCTWDEARATLDPQAISEQTDEMMMDTTCEDWHDE